MRPTDALPHPPEWTVKTVKEAVEIRRGLSWSKEQEREQPRDDTVPVLRITNIQTRLDLANILHLSGVPAKARTLKKASKDWSILVESNGNRNRIGNAVLQTEDTEFLFASFLIAAKPIEGSGILPAFFFRWLSTYEVQARISASAEGTTGLSNLAHDFFRGMEIAFPEETEQQDIIRILDAADAAIERTREAIAKARRVKLGLIQQLLRRGLSCGKVKQSGIATIPAHWETKRLREIADLQVGYPFRSKDFHRNGIRLLRGENVGYGRPSWHDNEHLPHHLTQAFSEYQLTEGDIVIGMDRTFTKSGFKISLIGADDLPSLLVQRVGRFIPSGNCDKQFLHAILQSAEYHRNLFSQQKGMDIPHLSKPEILNPLVAVPPLHEQEKIGQIVAAAALVCGRQQRSLQLLEKLKRGLMQDLLTGRVRVSRPAR